MNARMLIPLVAAALFSLSAHAHDCSGGANGGMDATGNQCNDTVAVATIASSDSATSSSARVLKGETYPSQSYSKHSAKRTVGARHTSARSGVKHS